MSKTAMSFLAMRIVDNQEYLRALLAAPRPGAEKILAFYDSRVDLVCSDPALLLIPLDDHMCHRGDGLFESIAWRESRLFALDAHIARLKDGARQLAIEPPRPFARIRELAREVAGAANAPHGDLRIFLSRGPGGFGISPGECPRPSLYVVAIASRLPDPALYQKGLSAFASVVPPKQEYLAKIKNTNYLPNVLMAREARDRQMDVAITFDANGNMGEAAIANVAIIDKNGVLRFPLLEGILSGTTLLTALRLAEQRLPVQQGPIHKNEIIHAKEMLLFTSATLCVPITSFDGAPIANGRPGRIAAWLREKLFAEMLRTGVSVVPASSD